MYPTSFCKGLLFLLVLNSLNALDILSSKKFFLYAQAYPFKVFSIQNSHKKSVTIPFRSIHNLVIIPVFINHSDTMRFILDSGISTTILTSLEGLKKDINFESVRDIDIKGLGVGRSIKGLISLNNHIVIPPRVEGKGMNLLILLENTFNLSFHLGIPIHGLIGYDVFKSFVVEIDYAREHLILHDPAFYKTPKLKKKRFSLPITIERSKAYLSAYIGQKNQSKIKVKLLIDSGASYGISLFTDSHEQIEIPTSSFHSFLGIGMSGDIYGEIGRIDYFCIGSSILCSPVVNFPEKESIQVVLKNNKNRHGTIGADILKRYKTTIDYTHRQIIFKRNKYFYSPFYYNMSGIDIITPFPGVNIYEIAKVRKNSPAYKSGLQQGDNIYAINGEKTFYMSLEKVSLLLQGHRDKRLMLSVYRSSKLYTFRIKINDPIESDRSN